MLGRGLVLRGPGGQARDVLEVGDREPTGTLHQRVQVPGGRFQPRAQVAIGLDHLLALVQVILEEAVERGDLPHSLLQLAVLALEPAMLLLELFVQTPEAREGLAAFNEKRAPDFAKFR